MIIDELEVGPIGDGYERAARFRWDGRSERVHVRTPLGVVDQRRGPDGSPFLAMGLLAAMMAGEDIEVAGPVSPLLLARLDEIITAYATWDHRLRPPQVRTEGPLDRSGWAPASGVGCFFSRGVDSMASAALERVVPAPLTHLVFCDGLEPLHSRPTADAEIRLAGEAAETLDLPLVLVDTNVRVLTEGRRDWADVHGGALAGIGLALGLSDLVIPSTLAFGDLVPYGSSPVLDPLYSTEATVIHHDDVSLNRVGKVWLLAHDRPDLLPLLKVCFAQDRPDNCGRCGKCLLTMCALQAAGALDQATGFPSAIDVEDLRRIRPSPLQSRMHWVATMRALGRDGPNGEVRDAIDHALRRSARPGPREAASIVWERARGRRASGVPSWRDPTRGFDWRYHAEVLSLLWRGRPSRPLADRAEPPLVRARARKKQAG